MKKMWAAVLLLLLAAACAWSQASNSAVRGSVRDTSDAVIPGATVTLTGAATGVQRQTSSNTAGLYVFPGVVPGEYRVAVEAAGMQRFEGALTVDVGRDAVVNVTLQVGQLNTKVEVLDVTPVVQTDSGALGHEIDSARIQVLPLNQRGYQNLLVTIPGVTWSSQGFGVGALVQGYGLRPGSTVMSYDGAPQNEVWEGWDVARPPDPDTISEIQVQTSDSTAKFSRPTTIVVSSKSGTNQLHGAIFETNRNSGYGVARARQDLIQAGTTSAFTKPPYLNRNEWGESLGGPIYIPKIYDGHNRTFFFFSWEDTRVLSNSTQQLSYPTAAMRNGDFSGLKDSLGRAYNFYDPYTTDPKTNQRQLLSCNGIVNTICPSRLSPTAKYLFGVTPLPTLPQVNPLIGTNWLGTWPSRYLNQEVKTTRIDHRISDRDLIYGRFNYGSHREMYAGSSPEMMDGISGVVQRWWPDKSLALTEIHTFSPTLTNEILASGMRDFQRRGAGAFSDFDTDYTSSLLGLPNPFGAHNFPSISGLDLTGYSFGGDMFFLITNRIVAQDNATKMYGKHEFQFGYQYSYESVPKSVLPTAGSFDYSTLATAQYDPASTASSPQALPLTGLGVANMYLGAANYGATFARPWVYMERQEHAVYFQDNWKPSPRLSLNMGLRWEYRTPVSDRNGALMGFDLNSKSYVLGTSVTRFEQLNNTLPSLVSQLQAYGGNVITNQQAGLPANLVNRDFSNLGPRFGFAYRALDGKKSFVIRGGYRISYYTMPLEASFNSQSSGALVQASFLNSVSNTSLSPDGLPNYGLRSVPKYVAGLNTPSSIIDLNNTKLITPGYSVYFMDRTQRDPRVQDWNFTIEKEVAANTLVRLSYVGNHVGRILQQVNYNDSTPGYIWNVTQKSAAPTGLYSAVATTPWGNQAYGGVYKYTPMGFSNFNGFNFEFERRFNHGLSFQAFYSLANILTEVTGAASSTTSIPTLNAYLPGAVPTDLAQRDRFLNYQRYTSGAGGANIPHMQTRYNWVWQLPFGKGKAVLGNAHGAVDKVIGGWAISGVGQRISNYFTLPTSIYPTGNQIQLYKYQNPVQDCRSGICYPAYLYWNGYISPAQVNAHNAAGQCTGVCGVPDNYKPAGAPLLPYGATSAPNAPAGTNLTSYYDTNTVWVPLSNGSVLRTTYNNNLHPWRNQWFSGPNQWFLDSSLFKTFRIHERADLKFNIDFFNVLNNPNNPTSVTSDGLLSVRNSGSTARTTQLSLHLSW